MVNIKIGSFLKCLLIQAKKTWNGKNLKFGNNAYWKKGNENEPFCQVCFVNKGNLIELQSVTGYDYDYECKNCKTTFNINKIPKVEVFHRTHK